MKCRLFLFFGDNKPEIEKEKFQYFKTVKLKIPRGRKSEFVVSCQVAINPFCSLSVIFCGFMSLLISRETINIPEFFFFWRSRLYGKDCNNGLFQFGLKLDRVTAGLQRLN